jgi:hypothetical protein
MDAAAIKDAFAKVQLWVARILGDAPSSEQTRLPNTEVEVAFHFPVMNGHGPAKAEAVLLTPDASGTGATLAWAIPIDTTQLKGVIRNWQSTAIWIKSASFILDGLVPNDRATSSPRYRPQGPT